VKLETQLREKIRSQGKADSTADAYWYWIERFLRFAKSKRGEWVLPAEMGRRQVEMGGNVNFAENHTSES